MKRIEIELGDGGRIVGQYDERMQRVADTFEQNFREHSEVGASVCLTLDGETVVDLVGGLANPADGTPWNADTISIVFSCTKGVVATCAHRLVSQGKLDVDAPVAEYWPEFARNGKQDATVRMMLDHSVGVPAIREPVRPGGCCDFDYMTGLLADEEPFWKPGTRNGYHMMSFGWTVGELVRRVSGKSLGRYFRDEIGEPLGLDFWIGLPEEHEPRVAPIIPFTPDPGRPLGPFVQALIGDPKSLQALSLLNSGGFDPNSRECHAAEIGGGGGIGNARGLAGLYAPLACGGRLGDYVLVDPDTLSRMGEVSTATNEDATLLIPTRVSLGFMKSIDNRRRRSGDLDSVVVSSAAFGHPGAGGSLGFADPEARMSFGYTMNRMGPGILLNERGQGLVDSAYAALGYTSNDGGVWRR